MKSNAAAQGVSAAAATTWIEATAYALPERILTNDDLFHENPTWNMSRLLERTGVSERRVAGEGETALDLAIRACAMLDAVGKLRPSEIDAVIFCTETPDHPIPPNACILHGRLSLRPEVMAFDITLACSGFIYALGIARGLLASGNVERVLVVTGDTYSRLIHPADRASRCLFGDGAAATIVSSHRAGPGSFRIVEMTFGTSGAQFDRFIVRAGGTRMPRSADTSRVTTDRSGNIRTAEHIEMDGLGVLSFFNSTIPGAVRELLGRHDMEPDDVGAFVFHQASRVAVEGIARGLALQPMQVILDIDTVGNLVSASIPVALQRAQADNRLPAGKPIVLCGFGVGLSWGTALLTSASS